MHFFCEHMFCIHIMIHVHTVQHSIEIELTPSTIVPATGITEEDNKDESTLPIICCRRPDWWASHTTLSTLCSPCSETGINRTAGYSTHPHILIHIVQQFKSHKLLSGKVKRLLLPPLYEVWNETLWFHQSMCLKSYCLQDANRQDVNSIEQLRSRQCLCVKKQSVLFLSFKM